MKVNQKFFDKRKNVIFYLALGIVGLILFIWVSIRVDGQEWFFKAYPDVKLYYATNVVSGWANFAYFTYLSLILFSLWCVLYFVAFIFKSDKLLGFLKNEATVTFITANYVISCIFYTVFALLQSPPNFSLYNIREPYAWFSFSTNIIIHYFYTAFVLVMFFKIDVNISKRKIYHLIPLLYMLVYYAIVKVTGMYVYRIEWYPYPIFHPQFMNEIFGIEGSNPIGYLFMVVACAILLVCYYGLYFGALKLKRSRDCANT